MPTFYQLVKDRNIIYTGDSRMAYCNATTRIDDGGPIFPEGGDLLVNRYQLNNNTVLNNGVPGLASTQLNEPQHLATYINVNPAPLKVFIEIGVLDSNGSFSDVQSIWVSIMETLVNVPYVYIMAPMLCTATGYATLGEGFTLANQVVFNTDFKAFFDSYDNVTYIDINPILVDDTGYLAESNTFDGIHPSYACYQLWWTLLDKYSYF